MHILLFLTLLFLASALDSSNQIDDDEILRIVVMRPSIKTIIMSTGSKTQILEAEYNSNRVERSAMPSTCKYPKRPKDSEVFCKVYVNRIECQQTCMFGYKLKGKQSRMMKCYFKEDKWNPVQEFESCEKHIDCSLRLETVGSVVCYTHFINHGPQCEVKCYGHGDNEETNDKHTCNEKGKWEPELPHCVRSGKGNH